MKKLLLACTFILLSSAQGNAQTPPVASSLPPSDSGHELAGPPPSETLKAPNMAIPMMHISCALGDMMVIYFASRGPIESQFEQALLQFKGASCQR